MWGDRVLLKDPNTQIPPWPMTSDFRFQIGFQECSQVWLGMDWPLLLSLVSGAATPLGSSLEEHGSRPTTGPTESESPHFKWIPCWTYVLCESSCRPNIGQLATEEPNTQAYTHFTNVTGWIYLTSITMVPSQIWILAPIGTINVCGTFTMLWNCHDKNIFMYTHWNH